MNELELTLGWVAKTVGGTLQSGDPELPVGDVLTDSRSLRAGDLFVALKGPRFDGHSFVEAVLERGAAGAIVERGYGGIVGRVLMCGPAGAAASSRWRTRCARCRTWRTEFGWQPRRG